MTVDRTQLVAQDVRIMLTVYLREPINHYYGVLWGDKKPETSEQNSA